MAKQRKGKYPNLDKSQNTKSRSDYIEPDYINGVFNDKGKEVIRPLTEVEKEWLNQFYGEFVAMSDSQLNPTDEIMEYMKEKAKCRKKIAKIRKEEKVHINSEINFLKSRITDIEACLDFLRAEQGVLHPTCDQQRDLYNLNNTRNFCVYNNRKARGMLIDLTTETYDSFVATFWDTLANFDYDSQDALIEIVEERLREEGFLPEQAPTEDFTNTGTNSNKKRNKA